MIIRMCAFHVLCIRVKKLIIGPNNMVTQLRYRRYPISEIQVARPGIETQTPWPISKKLNHSTTSLLVDRSARKHKR